MRLVTWNCCKGAYSSKVPLLDPLAADIAVIQECAKPPVESYKCLWVGNKIDQGLLVLTSGDYSIGRLPALDGVPDFVVPISVRGPGIEFVLLAVWAKAATMVGYVDCVMRAVATYRPLILGGPCVLMGDLNSSVLYARHCPANRNHGALVEELTELGLVSAYHGFF